MARLVPAGPTVAVVERLRMRPHTQAELVETTGLARMTVHDRLEALERIGMVNLSSQNAETGGRPARRYQIAQDFGRILVADVGTSVIRAGVATMDGTLLATSAVEAAAFDDPSRVIGEVVTAFERFVAMGDQPVRAICVGVPLSVDPGVGEPCTDPSTEAWARVDVRRALRRFCPGPVIVRHDVDLMALAEQRLVHPEARVLTFIKVGMGIGCSVVWEGETMTGENGGAFEVGHVDRRVAHARGSDRSPCVRGHDNCLETVAGGRAIASSLRLEGVDVGSSVEIMNLAVAGNTLVRDALFETGEEVGTAVSGLLDMLNPGVVVVGGNLTTYSDLVYQGFRETALARASELVSDAARIVPARLGVVGGLTGACLVVLDEFFSADSLDDLLSGSSVVK